MFVHFSFNAQGWGLSLMFFDEFVYKGTSVQIDDWKDCPENRLSQKKVNFFSMATFHEIK